MWGTTWGPACVAMRAAARHAQSDSAIGAVICTSMCRGQAIVTQHQLMPSAATPQPTPPPPPCPHPHTQPAPTHRHTRTRIHSRLYARKHAHNEPTPARHALGGRVAPKVRCNKVRTACCNVRCAAVLGCGGTHGACTSPRDQEASASSEDAANRIVWKRSNAHPRCGGNPLLARAHRQPNAAGPACQPGKA